MLSKKVKLYKEVAYFVINEISKKHRVTFYNVTETNILHIEYGGGQQFNPMYHINLDNWLVRYRTEKIKKLNNKINENS